MALEAQVNQNSVERPAHEESTVHLLAREGRIVMQGIMIVSGIATVICMMTIWPLAYVTAAIAMAAFVALMVAEKIERRSTAGDELDQASAFAAVEAERSIVAEEDEIIEVEPVELVKREGWIATAIVASAAIIALTLGLVFFDRTMVAIGSFVFFLYAILITWPAWLSWFEEDVDAHTPNAPKAIR
jgi:hypothetical protein